MSEFEKAPDKNVAENQMGKPLCGGNAPTQEGELFDEGARNQGGLFDEQGSDAGPVVDNPAQGGNFEEATGVQVSDDKACPDTADNAVSMVQDLTEKNAETTVNGVTYRIADDLGSVGLEGKGNGVIVTSRSPYKVSDIKRTDPADGVWNFSRAVEAAMNRAFPECENQPVKADKPKSSSYGSKNSMFTQELVEKDRAALMAKLKGRTSSNPVFDPEIMTLGARVVGYHIEAGTRKFIDVVRAVAADLETTPASLRQYLRTWYNGARDMMEDFDADTSQAASLS